MGKIETDHELQEQKYHLFDLVHDEYLESVIAGHNEDYPEWAEFAAWLILKATIPEQRNG